MHPDSDSVCTTFTHDIRSTANFLFFFCVRGSVNMGGRCKKKNREERLCADSEAELSPLPEETDRSAGAHSPVGGGTGANQRRRRKVGKCSSGSDKVYLGVRVKMPVRDLLKSIRLANSWEPQALQDMCKAAKGEKKRVKTRTARHTAEKKRPTKSLEELAIIVEVLEEDLKTGNTYCASPRSFCVSDSPVSPEWSPEANGAGFTSDDCDEMISSPESYMSYSPGVPEYHQTVSPPAFPYSSFQPSSCDMGGDSGPVDECWGTPNPDWNLDDSAFFWAQLQREENQLRDISDAMLLATDEHGRTAFHKVVCDGKRALAYAIAKRMAAINSLDLKDCDGMTALLHAATNNQHLMVDDLICLGADVNERNSVGKSCLHLSAEKGYIRVLEVLKQALMNGVYVNVEETDKSGMTVLQCASVALKATLHKLEISESPNHTRIHELRKEQLMETLECLLQMGSYFHTMGSWGLPY